MKNHFFGDTSSVKKVMKCCFSNKFKFALPFNLKRNTFNLFWNSHCSATFKLYGSKLQF